MEVNETRNCLVSDILLNFTKSPFQKKVEYPFNTPQMRVCYAHRSEALGWYDFF